MTEAHDPATSSYYISDEFYQQLLAAYSDWQRPERENTDPVARDACRCLLETEARLLQDGLFNEWLKMFAPQCVYWIPGTSGSSDPRREVAIAFDDRRRLEDRVYRLQLPQAWSQVPVSRTVRLVTNVQVFSTDAANTVMVRSHFMIHEYWNGDTRIWSGWNGHRLQSGVSGWKILSKQINLIDADQNLRNPSILL